MAAWQFQCNIIPLRENADKLSCDEMLTWKEISQPTINIDFLEREKGWSTDIVQYGKTDETCIEFYYNKGELEEINCGPVERNIAALHDEILVVFNGCLDDFPNHRPQVIRQFPVAAQRSKRGATTPNQAHFQMVNGEIRVSVFLKKPLGQECLSSVGRPCNQNNHTAAPHSPQCLSLLP